MTAMWQAIMAFDAGRHGVHQCVSNVGMLLGRSAAKGGVCSNRAEPT
jgi:hypothetical protein